MELDPWSAADLLAGPGAFDQGAYSLFSSGGPFAPAGGGEFVTGPS